MNWKNLIIEIQTHGLTQPQIAERCGCGQATISDLIQEKTLDPRHSLGIALQALLDSLVNDSVRSRAASGKRDRRDPTKPDRRVSPRSVADRRAIDKKAGKA